MESLKMPVVLEAAALLAAHSRPNHIGQLCSWGHSDLPPRCNSNYLVHSPVVPEAAALLAAHSRPDIGLNTRRAGINPAPTLRSAITALAIMFSPVALADSVLLQQLLQQVDMPQLVKQPKHHKLQLIYSRIKRDENGTPSFDTHYYRRYAEYVYPASTVKLPQTVLALEKINQLQSYGVEANSTMLTLPLFYGETLVERDETAASGLPSVAHYIKKILLVSDNDAFNRLYEFVGQQHTNTRLAELGFAGAEIIHRLESGLTTEQQSQTNAVRFVAPDGKLLFEQPAAKLAYKTDSSRKDYLGDGYYKAGALIKKPMDFSQKNRWLLEHSHQLVQWIMFPESQPAATPLKLTAEDYQLLRTYMQLPATESTDPVYAEPAFWPTQFKPLFYGSDKTVPVQKDLQIYNKLGDAYGFMLDSAYFYDRKNGVEFILSAVLYANEDGILNDDRYEYDSLARPFMQKFGQVVYQYELQQRQQK